MLKSDCSVFVTNDNTYATADSMLGTLTEHGNFAQSVSSDNTFNTTYDVLLPITLTGLRSMEVRWHDTWGAAKLAVTSLIPSTHYTVSLHFAEWYFTAIPIKIIPIS